MIYMKFGYMNILCRKVFDGGNLCDMFTGKNML